MAFADHFKTPFRRFLAGHILGYPVAFFFGVGAVPLAVLALPESTLEQTETWDIVWAILHKVHFWMYGAAAIPHLLVLPWVFAKERERPWRRFFWIATACVIGASAVAAVAIWIWFFARA